MQSSKFGVYWSSMFLTAMNLYEEYDPRNETHRAQRKAYRKFYNSIADVLPCRFCRETMSEKILPQYPLDLSGRRALMFTIYQWKDYVNKKLIAQGDKRTKPSPPFERVYAKWEALRARCDPKTKTCSIPLKKKKKK